MVFLHFLLKFKPFDNFCLFQNVMANLSLSVARDVCLQPLNKDVSQVITGTFFQYLLQKMVGWVAFEVTLRFMTLYVGV